MSGHDGSHPSLPNTEANRVIFSLCDLIEVSCGKERCRYKYVICKLAEPSNSVTMQHMENAASTIQHERAGREEKSGLLFFVHLSYKL